MKAVVLRDVGRLELTDAPIVPPGPRDVVVRMAAIGLCGTDFHIYAGHGNYHTDQRGRPIPLSVHPQVLGHELAGIVEETGAEVRDLKPGDRVIVDQGRNCHSAAREPACEYCTTGDSHQCAFYQEHGITGLPGGLAEFLTVPAVNAMRVGDSLPLTQAVVSEPLGCIVHASDMVSHANARYALKESDPERRVRSVLVCGAGPAGLLFVQYLRQALRFDGLLIVSEPAVRKRRLAESFGATTVDPTACDLADALLELTGGRRVEYLIDASGAAAVLASLPGLVRKQGTVLMYGHGHAGADLSVLNNVQFLEPTLVSPVGASGGFESDGRPSTYRRALSLVESGTVHVEPLLTHRYPDLSHVPAAFAGAHLQPDYVKGVVEI
jgi:2-desacetyl-2-hydroxyethyl bacteriochlorophyllide A dehydrogenase